MLKQVKISCPECGNQTFQLPDNLEPTDEITCPSCGYINTADGFIEMFSDKLKDSLSNILGKSFKPS